MYSRQINVIGEEAQQAISRSTAVIVGCGALGTVQAELLTRAGIGKLVLIDFDIVEESNLSRQHYNKEDLGRRKVDATKERLQKIRDIEIKIVPSYLSLQNIDFLDADIVLDGTDNMNTRFLINEYCKKNTIPAVFASAVLDKGSVLVVDEGPCYSCVFANKNSEEDCATTGVLNTTTELSGTISVNEAIKILTKQETMKGLFSFSLKDNRYDTLKLKENPTCKVCQGSYEKLNSKDSFSIRFCARVGGLRADPLNKKATKKVRAVEGHKVIVGESGEVFFPGLKDADLAKRLAEELV